jgi:hypothetical protein
MLQAFHSSPIVQHALLGKARMRWLIGPVEVSIAVGTIDDDETIALRRRTATKTLLLDLSIALLAICNHLITSLNGCL